MKLKIFKVDAFTDKIGSGNPAAVVWLGTKSIDEAAMQLIAAENNLSETAFILETKEIYSIRWFTPEREVDLCGHATLAASHVMKNHLGYKGRSISFESKSGTLIVKYGTDVLTMIFPARPAVPCEIPQGLEEALGTKPIEVCKARDYLVIAADEKTVLRLEPAIDGLRLPDCLGVIVSARGETADFVSRFFAPNAGIAEDPVTGSSHCTLIPYWARRLGKRQMAALQLSKRGGKLFCEDLGDTVSIGGKAVTFLEGDIQVPETL